MKSINSNVMFTVQQWCAFFQPHYDCIMIIGKFERNITSEKFRIPPLPSPILIKLSITMEFFCDLASWELGTINTLKLSLFFWNNAQRGSVIFMISRFKESSWEILKFSESLARFIRCVNSQKDRFFRSWGLCIVPPDVMIDWLIGHLIGVFPKWNRNSLNSANSGNLINHWSMN